MVKFFCILILLIFFHSKIKCQNSNDSLRKDQLFKETIPLFTSFLTLQDSNKDSATILGKILVVKYLNIYQLDATNKGIGDFLVDCYKYLKEFKKMIYWSRHQLLFHTTPLSKSVFYNALAYAFVGIGNIDSSRKYLKKAYLELTIYNKGILYFYRKQKVDLVIDIVRLADSLYFKPDAADKEMTKRIHTTPCAYSIRLLKLSLPYLKTDFSYIKMPFNKDTIVNREKKCR